LSERVSSLIFDLPRFFLTSGFIIFALSNDFVMSESVRLCFYRHWLLNNLLCHPAGNRTSYPMDARCMVGLASASKPWVPRESPCPFPSTTGLAEPYTGCFFGLCITRKATAEWQVAWMRCSLWQIAIFIDSQDSLGYVSVHLSVSVCLSLSLSFVCWGWNPNKASSLPLNCSPQPSSLHFSFLSIFLNVAQVDLELELL
jgi:hypothetical protein